MGGGPEPQARMALGRRRRCRHARSGGGNRALGAGPHSRQLDAGFGRGAAGDPLDPHCFRDRQRSGRARLHRQPRASRRQHDRLHLRRIRDDRQMAGNADGISAGSDAHRPSVQSRLDPLLRNIPAILHGGTADDPRRNRSRANSRRRRDRALHRAVWSESRRWTHRSARCLHRGQSRPDPASGGAAPGPGDLRLSPIRQRRRLDVIRTRHNGYFPAFRRLCRSHPEGCQPGRSAGAIADQVRAGDQCHIGEIAGPDGSDQPPRPRRRGDRVSEAVVVAPKARGMAAPKARGRLFRKYVALFVAVVFVALLANGLFEIWFSYQEHKAALVRIEREQAEAAATKIDQFVTEIQSQLGWTTQLPWSAATVEQHRFDGLRLLRQVPAITELAQLDATGHEELRVSRLATDVIGSQADLSHEPKFTEAMAHKVWYGPVYFRRDSEPYMTLAIAGARRDAGVSVAEVNLKFIWDVVSRIKVGEHGHAYVVDAGGRLIAHPDISLVLRDTDLSRLPQVQAARADAPAQASTFHDMEGRGVLSAHASIASLGWLVFIELPLDEAYAPLHASIERSGALLLAGLGLAFLAGLFLARRMVVPIRRLQESAERLGEGDL